MKMAKNLQDMDTFRYFLSCFGGFSPGNFLSNLPPLAVAVAAIPATFPNSSLLTFLGAAWLPVIGNAVAASWTWLHMKPHLDSVLHITNNKH